MQIPEETHQLLRLASMPNKTMAFECDIFDQNTNDFVELWAPRIFSFVSTVFGGYGTFPQARILPMEEGFHASGANASFNIVSGQIQLASTLAGKPGVLLEKLTHEMTHGALSEFPEGDSFYEEGFVDYSVWLMSHAPVWGEYREAMIQAAADNIRVRRERALTTGTDYDRKRWAGGVYAMTAYGPYLLATLRMRKLEGQFTW